MDERTYELIHNQETQSVLERCGCNYAELLEWFGEMNQDEILAVCNEGWPQDDNAQLATDIAVAIARIRRYA